MRIIGGVWRGSKIQFADALDLRPTSDRTRETLFNWLSPTLAGAHCLDLFAGSGILGLEALSRGAARVTSLDSSRAAVNLMCKEKLRIGAAAMEVIHVDAMSWLEREGLKSESEDEDAKNRYNIVFLDPPFSDEILPNVLEKLIISKLLAENAEIYIELPVSQAFPEMPVYWKKKKEKTTKEVRYGLFCLEKPDDL